jgi:hypothetical protein
LDLWSSGRRTFRLGKTTSYVPVLCFAIALVATRILRFRAEKGAFTIISPTEIENLGGYSVKMTESQLIYREGERTISIPRSHTAAGHAVFKIDPKTPLQWDGGGAYGPIDKEGQYKIRLRISRSIGFLQFTSKQQNKNRPT